MILEEIAAKTIERIEAQKKWVPIEVLKEQIFDADRYQEPKLSFPFERALSGPDLHFICEVKKASPSKGMIAEHFPYLDIAEAYEQAGADAISVLTEPYYFQGDNQYLAEIAKEVKVPVLRKDFVVDEYMIYEAKLLGASAVLLICSILEKEQLSDYLQLSHSLGMSALVEAHTEKEVETALSCKSRILGVNNRNLKDFTVDVDNSIKLRKLVPKDVIFVSESGMRTPEDVKRLREAGVNAVLIGETLMRSQNKAEALKVLRG